MAESREDTGQVGGDSVGREHGWNTQVEKELGASVKY